MGATRSPMQMMPSAALHISASQACNYYHKRLVSENAWSYHERIVGNAHTHTHTVRRASLWDIRSDGLILRKFKTRKFNLLVSARSTKVCNCLQLSQVSNSPFHSPLCLVSLPIFSHFLPLDFYITLLCFRIASHYPFTCLITRSAATPFSLRMQLSWE